MDETVLLTKAHAKLIVPGSSDHDALLLGNEICPGLQPTCNASVIEDRSDDQGGRSEQYASENESNRCGRVNLLDIL